MDSSARASSFQTVISSQYLPVEYYFNSIMKHLIISQIIPVYQQRLEVRTNNQNLSNEIQTISFNDSLLGRLSKNGELCCSDVKRFVDRARRSRGFLRLVNSSFVKTHDPRRFIVQVASLFTDRDRREL